MYIKVPEAVRIGDTVTLSCDYDLEQVALYTIKWYRYDEEFYRYVPKESPPSRVFPMEHITVDVSTVFLFITFSLSLSQSRSSRLETIVFIRPILTVISRIFSGTIRMCAFPSSIRSNRRGCLL